jgi:hypothetical protein
MSGEKLGRSDSHVEITTSRVAVLALAMTIACARQVPATKASAAPAPPAGKPGVHDVTVIHPRTVDRDGRPGWLWAFGNRRGYPLPDSICGAAPVDCVVTARIATERDDAVPVDVLRLKPGARSKTVVLPPGRYVVEARDASGTVLSRRDVTISDR